MNEEGGATTSAIRSTVTYVCMYLVCVYVCIHIVVRCLCVYFQGGSNHAVTIIIVDIDEAIMCIM